MRVSFSVAQFTLDHIKHLARTLSVDVGLRSSREHQVINTVSNLNRLNVGVTYSFKAFSNLSFIFSPPLLKKVYVPEKKQIKSKEQTLTRSAGRTPDLPVQGAVLTGPKLVEDWLDAQHQELVAQMDPEVQIVLRSDLTEDLKETNGSKKREKRNFAYLSCSLTENSIDEGHDGRLQADVTVVTCGPVQVDHQVLLTGNMLKMTQCASLNKLE